MTPAAQMAWPAEGARLLEPSISYALGAALAVTPELLARPTPCGELTVVARTALGGS